MSEPLVTLRAVSKQYGRAIAVNNLSLDVFEGELHNFANLASQRALVESVPRWIAGALQER